MIDGFPRSADGRRACGRRLRAADRPARRRGEHTARTPDAPPGRGAASPRAGTLDKADRPGAPPEHGNGPEPRPPPAASPRSDHASRSRRPTRPGLRSTPHAPALRLRMRRGRRLTGSKTVAADREKLLAEALLDGLPRPV